MTASVALQLEAPARAGCAGGYDRDVAVVIEGSDPLPFTLLSIASEYQVGD